jgi:hypothetical protein
MTALSGVRSSWLMVARKRDFAADPASAATFAASTSARMRRSSVTSEKVMTKLPSGVGSEVTSMTRPSGRVRV